MKHALTLALKDLKLLFRDKAAAFWVLGFPLLMAIFFGAIFSGSSGRVAGMRVIVVDHDQTEQSLEFIRNLDDSEALQVVTAPLDTAQARVRRGAATAYVLIPEGFGAKSMFNPEDRQELEVGIDPARRAEVGYLQGLIAQASFMRMGKMFSDPSTMRQELDRSMDEVRQSIGMGDSSMLPVQKLLDDLDEFYETQEQAIDSLSAVATPDSIADTTAAAAGDGGGIMSGPKISVIPMTRNQKFPKSSYEITFPSAIMWGLIAVAAAFGISIVQEKVRGTFLRLRIAPINRTHILAGKGIACFLACVMVCVFLMLIGKFIFGVSTEEPLKLALAIFSAVFCFVGLMMLISVSGKSEQAVGGIGWAVMLVFSMTGGGMVPLIAMPSWMLTLSNISPVKWGIVAIEGAIWRGYTYGEMLLPVGVLLGIGFVTFFLGVFILSRTDK